MNASQIGFDSAAAFARPLLSSFSILDILLPPILLGLSLLLHTLYNTPLPTPDRIHAHLYRAKTAHARFLPVEAKHVFSYPVLFFGFDLDALESGRADLSGRWFAYDSTTRRVVATVRPGVYFEPSKEGITIKSKLLGHLSKRGLDGEILAKRVYTVTMPAFLGLQDINPLTIHYCYEESEEKGRRRLRIVVLEVSNTFGEKHLYVLETGVKEDDTVSKGYEHQWTFPRAFHVSPFNDRTGFYRVSVVDPLRSDSTSLHLPANPHLDIKIVTLTSDGEKKLYASLAGPSSPLTESSLLGAVLRWPLALLLTTPRILYQAMLLHYGHRLDVFPRPDPFVVTGEDAAIKDGILNPVEREGLEGGVQWQELGGMETLAMEKTVAFLRGRVQDMADGKGRDGRQGRRIRVVLQPADKTRETIHIAPEGSGTCDQTLTIAYLSPLFYVDLYAAPTIKLALEMGSHTERRWTTSDDQLFLEVFASPSLASKPTRAVQTLQRMRLSMLRWGLSFDHLASASAGNTSPPLPESLSPHPLDTHTTWSDVRTVAFHFFFVKFGYWLFVLTRARFVRGTEPWEEWARWAQRARRIQSRTEDEIRSACEKEREAVEIKFGSVLRGR